VPSVVEQERPSTVARLLESPLVRIAGNLPAPSTARHHLHVVAADQAEHTRLDHRFQLLQRLIKQVVLHHPELKTSPLSFVGHALRAREVIGKGLLQMTCQPCVKQAMTTSSLSVVGNNNSAA